MDTALQTGSPPLIIEPQGEARSSIIWLHGLGADGHDFEPIARELNLPERLGTRFIFPHAPRRAVTINGGLVMRAWYDIAHTDIGRTPDLQGVTDSCRLTLGLLEHEVESGIRPDQIIVAGFSQGGVIASAMLTRYPGMFKGAIALSCYDVSEGEFIKAERPHRAFVAHGSKDTIVPVDLGRTLKNRLIAAGYDVDWHEYPIPHSVSQQEIQDIRTWIIQTLDAS